MYILQQETRAVHTKVKLKTLRITYNGINFSLKVHVNRRYSAIEYSIYDNMTTARLYVNTARPLLVLGLVLFTVLASF